MKSKISIKKICDNSATIWHNIRWRHTLGVVTCRCGCTDVYHLSDGRYRCKRCRRKFSDRTGTIMQGSRLPISTWLIAMFHFSACQECSALNLMKMCNVNYRTAHMMLQKLRYAVGTRAEEVTLRGLVQIDEAYVGAQWNNVHFKTKLDYMKKHGYLDKDGHYNKRSLMMAASAKKSHILSMVDEFGHTRLLQCPNPIVKDTIEFVLKLPMMKGCTGLITDESGLYRNLDIPVYTSNHTKRVFVTAGGLTSNSCENRFSWVKRRWEGVYTHTSDKYLQLYLWHREWIFNNMDKSVDERFNDISILCAHVRVRNSDIYDYNYLAKFPEFKTRWKTEARKMLDAKLGPQLKEKTHRRHRATRK